MKPAPAAIEGVPPGPNFAGGNEMPWGGPDPSAGIRVTCGGVLAQSPTQSAPSSLTAVGHGLLDTPSNVLTFRVTAFVRVTLPSPQFDIQRSPYCWDQASVVAARCRRIVCSFWVPGSYRRSCRS